MSTNGREAPAGDDGFGGSGTSSLVPRDGDDILEDDEYSGGDEFEMDPALTIPGSGSDDGMGQGAGQQRQPADPWAGFDDEARQIAQEKGWRTPADMAKAYRSAESKIGSRETEAEQRARQAEARAAALEAMLQQGQQAGQQDQGGAADAFAEVFQPIDYEELERVGNGDPRQMFAIYHEQVVLPQVRKGMALLAKEMLGHVNETVGGRVAPLEQGLGRISVRDQAQELARDFPQDFPRLRSAVLERLTRDPQLRAQADGMRVAFNDALARDYRERMSRSRMAQEGDLLVGGAGPGRARQQQSDPDAELRDALDNAAAAFHDGLG